ncbi:unnamed protein product [Rhizoctonia solani]|uniref:Protein kinase domain-containing protein n=1 Tax=Rhizoctonia solani TaxID=456999 RepID=A0A8H2WL95_9AGAM|nr:unnamed protein product [Rhizoctonia solani]
MISIKPGFKRIIWGLLLSCWQRNPEDRPSANVVRDILSIVSREGTTIGNTNEPTRTTIEHTLPLPTIIERLVDHGCLDVTSRLTGLHEHSRWSGKMSDVYQARLLDGTPVAVKCLREFRNSENQPDKILKHTAHEMYTWSISTHPNVLELIGLAVVRDRLAMVAPWVEYGNLLAYIRAEPSADRYHLVADGLAYMHSLGVAHGDIKGDNIVVSKDGTVKITDFGCATMKREFPVAFTATDSLHYSVRWAAPELFLDNGSANFETDVYALGMTILEAITGSVPHQDRPDMAVILEPRIDLLADHRERMVILNLENALYELSRYRCLNLTEQVTFLGDEEDISVIGGFYDIYKASLVGYEGLVAVKFSVNIVLEHIVNELRVVSKLEHPNVLPCLGYILTEPRGSASYDRSPRTQQIIGIVYPWMDLNLRDYLKLRPEANRASLCNQIVEGLIYLHNTGVMHGDLRGRAIMISEQGTVQITGFGGSVLKDDPPGYGNGFQIAGRWAAPERLLPVGAEPTVKADIWSLGMTILVIGVYRDAPYPELSELNALIAVANGEIPTRPSELINLKTGYDEILWALISICFQLVPGNRPSLNSVRDIMNVIQREGQINIQTDNTERITIKHNTTLPTIIDRLVDQGCLNITKQLTYMDESHKYSGALSDVYQARLFSGRLVAVKCLRALTNSENKPEKVLKCTQVAEGLVYIHGLGIAHGDIKGDNVVVSNKGVAKIADFGCATMRRDFPVAFTATESVSYSVRWADRF